MRNRRSQFSAISMGFPPDSRRLSIHVDRFAVIFNQFQSVSVNFSQFESVLISLIRSKTLELIDNWKVGKTTRNYMCTAWELKN